MREPELVEVSAADAGMLDRIGRLRVRAWETVVGTVDGLDCWLDPVDATARHWAFLSEGEPVAAARLSVHSAITHVPDAECYATVLRESLVGPIASFNRLVVAPEWRGRGLSGRLDRIRIEVTEAVGCRSAVVRTASGDRRVEQLQQVGFEVLGRGERYSHPLTRRLPPPLILVYFLHRRPLPVGEVGQDPVGGDR